MVVCKEGKSVRCGKGCVSVLKTCRKDPILNDGVEVLCGIPIPGVRLNGTFSPIDLATGRPSNVIAQAIGLTAGQKLCQGGVNGRPVAGGQKKARKPPVCSVGISRLCGKGCVSILKACRKDGYVPPMSRKEKFSLKCKQSLDEARQVARDATPVFDDDDNVVSDDDDSPEFGFL